MRGPGRVARDDLFGRNCYKLRVGRDLKLTRFNPPDPLSNILITLPSSAFTRQLKAASSITSHLNSYASGIPHCSTA